MLLRAPVPDAAAAACGAEDLGPFREAAARHEHQCLPGALRASAGVATTLADIERLLEAVATVATTAPPVDYAMDPASGDAWPAGFARPTMSARRRAAV